MTTGNTIALIIWTFVGKVLSLLFNMLSRFVIAFLSRNKHLLISWLQSLLVHLLIQEAISSLHTFYNNYNHSFILIYFCSLIFFNSVTWKAHYHPESLNISYLSCLIPCIFLYWIQSSSFINELSTYHVLSIVLRAWIAFLNGNAVLLC